MFIVISLLFELSLILTIYCDKLTDWASSDSDYVYCDKPTVWASSDSDYFYCDMPTVWTYSDSDKLYKRQSSELQNSSFLK